MSVCKAAACLSATFLFWTGCVYGEFNTGGVTLKVPPLLVDANPAVESAPDSSVSLPGGEGTIEFWFRPFSDSGGGKSYQCLFACGRTVEDSTLRFDVRYAGYLTQLGVENAGFYAFYLQVGKGLVKVFEVAPNTTAYVAIVFSPDETVVHSIVDGDVCRTKPRLPALTPLVRGSDRLDPVSIGGLPTGSRGLFFEGGDGTRYNVEDEVDRFAGQMGEFRIWKHALNSAHFTSKPPTTWLYDAQSIHRRLAFPYPGDARISLPRVDDLVTFSRVIRKENKSRLQLVLADPLEGAWVGPRQEPTVNDKAIARQLGPEDIIGPVCDIVDAPVYSMVKEKEFDGRYYLYKNGVFAGYLNGSAPGSLQFTSIAGEKSEVDYDRDGVLRIQRDGGELRLRRLEPSRERKGQAVSADDSLLESYKIKDAEVICHGYDLLELNPERFDDTGKRDLIFANPYQLHEVWYKAGGRAVPASFNIVDDQESWGNFQNSTVSSRKQHLESWGLRFGLRGGTGGKMEEAIGATTSVGVAGGFRESSSVNRFTQHMEAISRSYSTVSTLSLDRLEARLSDGFMDAVSKLADSRLSMDDFIDDFGTHYAHGVTFGGMLCFTQTMDEESIERMSSSSTDASASYRWGTADSPKFEATAEVDFSKSEGQEQVTSAGKVKVRVVGGAVLNADPMSTSLQVTDETAKPILMDLRPIYELLSPLYFDDPQIYLDTRFQLQEALQKQVLTAHREFFRKHKFHYADDTEFAHQPTVAGSLHVVLDSIRANFDSNEDPDLFGEIAVAMVRPRKSADTVTFPATAGPITLWQPETYDLAGVSEVEPTTWTITNRTLIRFPSSPTPATSPTMPESWGKYYAGSETVARLMKFTVAEFFQGNIGRGVFGIAPTFPGNFRHQEGFINMPKNQTVIDKATVQRNHKELVDDGKLRFSIASDQVIDRRDWYELADAQESDESPYFLDFGLRLFEDDGSDGAEMRCEPMLPTNAHRLYLSAASPQTLQVEKEKLTELKSKLAATTFESDLDRTLTSLKADIAARQTSQRVDDAIIFCRQLLIVWAFQENGLPRQVYYDLSGLLEIYRKLDRSTDSNDLSQLQRRLPSIIDAFKQDLTQNKAAIVSAIDAKLTSWDRIDRLSKDTADVAAFTMAAAGNENEKLTITFQYWWDRNATSPTAKQLARARNIVRQQYSSSKVVFPVRTRGDLVPTQLSAMDWLRYGHRAVAFGEGAEDYLEYLLAFEPDGSGPRDDEGLPSIRSHARRPISAARVFASTVTEGRAQSKDYRLPVHLLPGPIDAIGTVRDRGVLRQFVFSGDECIEVKTTSVPGQKPYEVVGPMKIAKRFNGLPPAFQQGIDAATGLVHVRSLRSAGRTDVRWGNRLMLYRGKQRLHYDLGRNEVTLARDWLFPAYPGFPERFQQDLDAVCKIYAYTCYIKGDECVVQSNDDVAEGKWKLFKTSEVFPNARLTKPPPKPTPLYERQNAIVGDFDGDGRSDVLVADGQFWHIYYMARGEWDMVRESPHAAESLTPYDFDGNGYTDLFRYITKRNGAQRDPGTVLYFGEQAVGNRGSEEDWDAYAPWNGVYRFGHFNSDSEADAVIFDTRSRWGVYTHRSLLRSVLDTENSLSPNPQPPSPKQADDRYPIYVTVGNFDGEGKDDLVVQEAYVSGGSTRARWYLWSGGTQRKMWFDSPWYFHPELLVTGDFNRDGFSDIVAANHSNVDDPTADFLVQYGGSSISTWQKLAEVNAPYSQVNSLHTGDFNDDGISDIFWASPTGMKISLGARENWKTLDEVAALGPLDHRQDVVVGDFDGDGRSDVLVADGQTWHIYYMSKQNWEFIRVSPHKANALTPFDVDGNGSTDLFRYVEKRSGSQRSPGTVLFFGGDHAGNSGKEKDWQEFGPWNGRYLLGNFNDDTWADALHFDARSRWGIYPRETLKHFDMNKSFKPNPQPGDINANVWVGNFDGEGADDVLLQQENNRRARWFLWPEGKQGKRWGPDSPWYISLQHLLAGDFDGDGRVDILFANELGQRRPDGVKFEFLLRSAGSEQWSNSTRDGESLLTHTSLIPQDNLHVGDFDGDGVSDVLWASPNGILISLGARSGWTSLDSINSGE